MFTVPPTPPPFVNSARIQVQYLQQQFWVVCLKKRNKWYEKIWGSVLLVPHKARWNEWLASGHEHADSLSISLCIETAIQSYVKSYFVHFFCKQPHYLCKNVFFWICKFLFWSFSCLWSSFIFVFKTFSNFVIYLVIEHISVFYHLLLFSKILHCEYHTPLKERIFRWLWVLCVLDTVQKISIMRNVCIDLFLWSKCTVLCQTGVIYWKADCLCIHKLVDCFSATLATREVYTQSNP